MEKINLKGNKMFKKILTAILLLVSVKLLGHEGHDHNPGALKANYGGVVKAGQSINLEYVIAGDELKLYPATHESKDIPLAEVILKATTKLPKGKAEDLKLVVKDGAYIAKLDFKGAYRIEISVNADNKGQKSSFKFQVER